MTTAEPNDTPHTHDALETPETCRGAKCGHCTNNNFACGDPECCGANYDYCVACDYTS